MYKFKGWKTIQNTADKRILRWLIIIPIFEAKLLNKLNHFQINFCWSLIEILWNVAINNESLFFLLWIFFIMNSLTRSPWVELFLDLLCPAIFSSSAFFARRFLPTFFLPSFFCRHVNCTHSGHKSIKRRAFYAERFMPSVLIVPVV